MGRGETSIWLPICAAITVAQFAIGAALLPYSRYDATLPLAEFIPNWALLMLIVGLSLIVVQTARMMLRRCDRPASTLWRWSRLNKVALASVGVGFLLCGALQLGFNWVKPQLAIVFPFWADTMLADFDAWLFGGEPWLILRERLGRGVYFLDWVYSLWYPVTVTALFGVFLRRRNARPVIAYFLLWGVFGVILQAACSAAGPIFWSRIGLGDRFDGLFAGLPEGSVTSATYLWAAYSTNAAEVGAGISAMPSLHVAMAAWIAIAYAPTRFMPLAFAYYAFVFLGSVALGWHYFADGLVGTAGTLACWYVAGVATDVARRRGAVERHHVRSLRTGSRAVCAFGTGWRRSSGADH